MPAGQQQQQQPATVAVIGPMSAVTPPATLTGYLHRQSIGVGIILIVIGTLSVVFNVVGIAVTVDTLQKVGYYAAHAVASHGLWGGVLVRNANALLVMPFFTARCT